jgi:FtsP/CotA-like multicopper oxidase with cupredoxin domain
MKQQLSYKMLSLSLLASVVLVGCGGGNSVETVIEQTLAGSAVKGPISDANITLWDANNTLIDSTVSNGGIFSFPKMALNSEYYTLKTENGRYTDEATDSNVTLSGTQRLSTLLSKAELQNMLSTGTFVALTPETTMYARLVQNLIDNNTTVTDAQTQIEALITKVFIEGTSPLSVLPGDVFLKKGNLTTAIPKNQTEAFARNRSISMSYLVRDLGLTPDKVFELMDLVVADLGDGVSNGITIGGQDINVTEEFGLARAKLFQDTTTKLRNGQLSNAQKEELRLMGFNVDMFDGSLATDQALLDAEVATYLASTTLPILHVLPTMNDEDGNATDNQATYTLTANKDVNVTIETPDGSWVTPMWRYNNNPLPLIIRTNRGNAMTLNLNNQLDSNSTIHWHGFKIPADMDGGPDTPVVASGTKAYTFTMNQPAAPLWFHPHPDMETGKQVYMGLAGVYLLEDNITKTLELNKELPSAEKDTVLLVQDRRFDGNSTDSVRNLMYMDMEMDMDGMLGDTILVNGSVVPKQEVSNTLHRYRLYNVSNARNYKFALSDGSAFTIIGTDGGLLDTPTSVTSVTLGAAERVEIVIDFRNYNVGDKVMLVSQPFNGDMMGMMGNMNGMSAGSMAGMAANGAGLSIMRFDILNDEAEDVTLYTSLPNTAEIKTRHTEGDATNTTVRQFLMTMGGMGDMNDTSTMNGMQMSFVINGKTFDPNRVDEFIDAGAIEVWSIRNMSPMAHPFHAHAIQYQILSRNGIPATGSDLGWKDTFLVQPGETVKVIGKFEAINTGDYMYHCHILEHEDAGMMGYFRVGDTGVLGAQ